MGNTNDKGLSAGCWAPSRGAWLPRIFGFVGGALVGLSVAGVVWEWLGVYATEEFFKQETHHEPKVPSGLKTRATMTTLDQGMEELPTASVLIPLKGASPANKESIICMLGQDYPQLEVIVGTTPGDAAAIELVKSIQQEKPDAPLKLVAAPNKLGGPRPKVANLHNAREASNSPLLAMVDADILAGEDFFRRLLTPLLNPSIGLTTCLYRAGPGGSVWSRVDGLWSTTAYLPSALFGRRVIGESFAFGAAIGIRRDVLDEIGGFQAIAQKVGDDYQLGHLAAAHGYKVQFVPYVVTEQVETLRLRQFFNRRVRWFRTIRTFHPAGYAGSIITYSIPLALLAALCAPQRRGRWSWLGLVLVNRVLCAHLNRRHFEPDAPLHELWLVPVRDVLALIAWAMGFTRERLSSTAPPRP